MKIRSVGNRDISCGRTDVKNLMVTFQNFATAPTKSLGLKCGTSGGLF